MIHALLLSALFWLFPTIALLAFGPLHAAVTMPLCMLAFAAGFELSLIANEAEQ